MGISLTCSSRASLTLLPSVSSISSNLSATQFMVPEVSTPSKHVLIVTPLASVHPDFRMLVFLTASVLWCTHENSLGFYFPHHLLFPRSRVTASWQLVCWQWNRNIHFSNFGHFLWTLKSMCQTMPLEIRNNYFTEWNSLPAVIWCFSGLARSCCPSLP